MFGWHVGPFNDVDFLRFLYFLSAAGGSLLWGYIIYYTGRMHSYVEEYGRHSMWGKLLIGADFVALSVTIWVALVMAQALWIESVAPTASELGHVLGWTLLYLVAYFPVRAASRVKMAKDFLDNTLANASLKETDPPA